MNKETLKHISPEYQEQLAALAILLCVRDEYKPSPYDIEDTTQGFDIGGNYHHPFNPYVVDL